MVDDDLPNDNILLLNLDEGLHCDDILHGLDDEDDSFPDNEGDAQSEYDITPVITNPYREEAIRQIENIILSFLVQLNGVHDERLDKPKTSNLKRVHSERKRVPEKIKLQLVNRDKVHSDGSIALRTFSMPKNATQGNVRSFAQLFKVLDIVHKALINDIPVTKRDIYYQDVRLFGSQRVVDRLVDDLAATFNLGRADLNVRAASKGLVLGSALVIHLLQGESVQANDAEGILIPAGEVIRELALTADINWVLIVEKEAIFQTLCRLRLTSHEALPGRGLAITGKGYPDVATREFVKSLDQNLPASVPILALVDADPYGLDILSVYKRGSRAMRHENDKLAAERVEWLGVWTSELAEMGIDSKGMIPLTECDKKKASAMLKRDGIPAQWKNELMHMMHCRMKAEIEIICSLDTDTLIRDEAEPEDDQRQTSDSQDRARRTTSLRSRADTTHPLLIYLSRKITHFVHAYSALS